MSTIGNLIWFIFGGAIAALIYIFGGIALCLTIVGIPFGMQLFKLAGLVAFPFGKEIRMSRSSGLLSIIFNILWLIFGGLEVALGFLVLGVIFCITIIGIPFGKQAFKLALLSLMPFGQNAV